VVSAQASASDLKPAPALATASSTLSKSRVERARRSKRVTNRTSPGPRAAIARASAFRSVTAPLIFSERFAQRQPHAVPLAVHLASDHLCSPLRSLRSSLALQFVRDICTTKSLINQALPFCALVLSSAQRQRAKSGEVAMICLASAMSRSRCWAS
jgi:hypothetical protein